jgi:hypothetical protein
MAGKTSLLPSGASWARAQSPAGTRHRDIVPINRKRAPILPSFHPHPAELASAGTLLAILGRQKSCAPFKTSRTHSGKFPIKMTSLRFVILLYLFV